jgi:hypothetical protein
MMFSRHYTVAEANASLPRLRRWFGMLHELDKELVVLHEQYAEVLENRWLSNVGGSELSRYLVLSVQWRNVIDSIFSLGVQIKDLDRGLCDFPHIQPETGDEVFLCWELSEPEVGFWHPVDTGYAGRQPLAPSGRDRAWLRDFER